MFFPAITISRIYGKNVPPNIIIIPGALMQNEEQKGWRIHAVSEGCNVTVIDPHFVCR